MLGQSENSIFRLPDTRRQYFQQLQIRRLKMDPYNATAADIALDTAESLIHYMVLYVKKGNLSQ